MMKLSTALLALAVIFSGLQSAAAQQPAPDPDPWRFNVALYGWAMNIGGNVTVRGQTIDTSASIIDLIQKSDSLASFLGYVEADKGRLGVYTDLVFAKLGFGAGQANYRNPLPGLSLNTSSNAALTYQLFIVEMGGAYELVRWPGATQGSVTALDGLLGFRYWNNTLDASFNATATASVASLGLQRSFGLSVSTADTVQWVDPLVGLRLRHSFTPNQQVFVRGDVGGFGLGSQFTWQAVGAYSYSWQFTGYQVAAVIGFRALGVSYSAPGDPGFGINEVLYGPIIGASFRF